MDASTTADTLNGDSQFIFNINQQRYYFQVALINLDGAAQYLKPTAIKAFVIEDNFKNIFHKGYIIIDNMTDFIERSDSADVSNNPNTPDYYAGAGTSKSNQDVSFLIKGESRDILHIDIIPILDSSYNDGASAPVEVQHAFRLIFDFAIYNMEEIPGDKPSHKSKKFYFHDLYYELLTEKNTLFSTSNYVTNGNVANLDNTERTISTGLAIQALLGETFPQTSEYPLDIYYDDSLGNSFNSNQTTAPITAQTIGNFDSTNTGWDVGGGNIFFSSPPKFKAIDCLNYILSRHVSNADSNYDQCFLRLERSPRAMSFRSLKQYFDTALEGYNAGALYLETARIGNYNTEALGEDLDAYGDKLFSAKDGVYFSQIGTIKSYTFDNMAGMYSQSELVSNFVHSYTYNGKQFNIDMEQNSTLRAMDIYNQNYVQNMLDGGDDGTGTGTNKGPYPNFAPGTIRTSNNNINNNFSVVDDDTNVRLAWGRNRFLYAGALTNNLISFRLKGSTHRQAGRFIGIDRDGAMSTSQFDDKILGVYFILEVRHVFEGGQYFNDLHCIKTYNTLLLPTTDKTTFTSSLI
jgi:hypothetical protein